MNSLYRQILGQAWQITKKFRYLWPLGLFAAFLGNSSEYQILFKQSEKVSEQQATISIWHDILNSFTPNWNIFAIKPVFVTIIFIITLVIIALFIWLAIASLGGLIKGAALASDHKKQTFGQLLKTGNGKFWPILGLNIIAKLIIYAVLVLFLGPLMLATFAQGNVALNLFITLLTFVIFVPVAIIVSLVTKYGSAFVILEGKKTWESFKNGWRMFAANWLVSLEMAFVIFIINIAVGLVFALVALLVFSPFFVFGMLYSTASVSTFNILMVVSMVVLLALSLVVGAVLTTFQISSWTLLFLKLNSGEKVYSKIIRWAAGLPNKFKKKETV